MMFLAFILSMFLLDLNVNERVNNILFVISLVILVIAFIIDFNYGIHHPIDVFHS